MTSWAGEERRSSKRARLGAWYRGATDLGPRVNGDLQGALGEGEPQVGAEAADSSPDFGAASPALSPSPSAPWSGEFDDAVERGDVSVG